MDEGLQVPLQASKAEKMMRAQGWKKGEPLGKTNYEGTRILTPLSPFTANYQSHGETRGLKSVDD